MILASWRRTLFCCVTAVLFPLFASVRERVWWYECMVVVKSVGICNAPRVAALSAVCAVLLVEQRLIYLKLSCRRLIAVRLQAGTEGWRRSGDWGTHGMVEHVGVRFTRSATNKSICKASWTLAFSQQHGLTPTWHLRCPSAASWRGGHSGQQPMQAHLVGWCQSWTYAV